MKGNFRNIVRQNVNIFNFGKKNDIALFVSV